jgi:hypothetical protein
MKGEQKGFSYSVNKESKEDSTNKASFIIGFTFGEAIVLREALIDSIKASVQSPPQQRSRGSQNESYGKQLAVDTPQQPSGSLDDEDMW